MLESGQGKAMRSFLRNLFGLTNSNPNTPMHAFLQKSDKRLWSFIDERNKRFREEEARKATLCTEAKEVILKARGLLSKELLANRIRLCEFDTHWANLLARLRRLYTPRIVGYCLESLGLPNVDEYGGVIHEIFLYP